MHRRKVLFAAVTSIIVGVLFSTHGVAYSQTSKEEKRKSLTPYSGNFKRTLILDQEVPFTQGLSQTRITFSNTDKAYTKNRWIVFYAAIDGIPMSFYLTEDQYNEMLNQGALIVDLNDIGYLIKKNLGGEAVLVTDPIVETITQITTPLCGGSAMKGKIQASSPDMIIRLNIDGPIGGLYTLSQTGAPGDQNGASHGVPPERPGWQLYPDYYGFCSDWGPPAPGQELQCHSGAQCVNQYVPDDPSGPMDPSPGRCVEIEIPGSLSGTECECSYSAYVHPDMI